MSMNARVISQTTACTIGPVGAVKLHRVNILDALTGTCVITGFPNHDGATAQSITFPAGTAAGSYEFAGAVNTAAAMTVTCSTGADDNLVVVVYEAN